MRISDHFRKQEFEKSGTAKRLKIDNTMKDPELLMNVTALAANILEPLRAKWGPVSLSSGYRIGPLSLALGSSENSQHCFAEAVDLECFKSPGNRTVFEWVIKESGLSWDQIILEYESEQPFGSADYDPFEGWIHISSKRCLSENRKEILRAVTEDGNTVYKPGIN
tara:strand:+ start:95 stop:592 length:498 start_codon:yes stop_codon:yes gene_type:complete